MRDKEAVAQHQRIEDELKELSQGLKKEKADLLIVEAAIEQTKGIAELGRFQEG